MLVCSSTVNWSLFQRQRTVKIFSSMYSDTFTQASPCVVSEYRSFSGLILETASLN